jgi:uncharacterized membrane protein YkvA (DUF1232 family)
MKKLLGTYAAVKGLSGAKKQLAQDSSWFDDLADVVKMIQAALKGTYRIRKRTILLVLTSIGYIISPIDFMPGFLLGPLGLLDDAAILLFAYKRILSELAIFRSSSKTDKVEIIL